MEYNVPEPIITERHSYLKFLLVVLFVAIAMSAALHVYIRHQSQPAVSEEVVPPTNQPGGEFPGSYGLNEDSTLDTPPVLSGTFYLSSVRTMASDTAPLPRLFTYSLADKKLSPLSGDAQFDFHMFGPASAVVLAPTTNNDDTKWQPYRRDIKSGTLTPLQNVQGSNVDTLDASVDGASYAYSYQTKEQAAADSGSFDNWNIAIHQKGGEVTKIPKAHEPKWLPGGTTLLYIAEDGLYRYDVLSKTTTHIFTNYAPYTIADDIAVSPNGKTVILTRLATGLLSVLTLSDNGNFFEAGRLFGNAAFYLRPVFSADGKYYAVVSSSVSDATTIDRVSSYTVRNAVEIRTLANAAVLEALPLPDSNIPLLLNSWSPINSSPTQ